MSKIIDFSSSIVLSDTSLLVVGDPSTGQLFKVPASTHKNYLTASGVVGTSSYFSDSSSFDTRIKNVTGSFVNSASFVTTSSFNTLSSSYAADSGSFNSRINNVSGVSGSIPSGIASAVALGIIADGSTDQTTALNNILASSSYYGIVMDFAGGGAVKITGNVNAQSKKIYFKNGSYFTGTGSLTSAVIDAGYDQKLFDTSVSLTSSFTSQHMFSVKWYGAKNDGGTDDIIPLQKSSDTVISSTTLPRVLYLPGGSGYRINSPWILHNWNGTKYNQFNLTVTGQENVQGSPVTNFSRILCPNLTQSFAIDVQRATGGQIRNLSIEGGWTTNFANFETFVSSSFNDYAPTLRDSQFSPNAGIVIDAFANSHAYLPPDGGYPGFSGSDNAGGSGTTGSWYRGDGSNGGTTDFKITNCVINGFTVDVCVSPNGSSLQGENITIEHCQLERCKVAIAFCELQTDRTRIYNTRHWTNVYTVVDNFSYGLRKGTISVIDGVNVAGNVKRLFNISCQKAMSIKNIYAESFFELGTVASATAGISMEDCSLEFGTSVLTPKDHFILQNVTVRGGTWRYYTDLFNIRLRSNNCVNTTFENVFFDLPPLIISQGAKQNVQVKYVNCLVNNGGQILGMTTDKYSMQTGQVIPIPYGRFKIQDNTGITDIGTSVSGLPQKSSITWDFDTVSFDRITTGIALATMSIDAVSRTSSFSASAGATNLLQNNDVIYDAITGWVLGRVSSINTGSNTLTISEIPINYSGSNSYNMGAYYYVGSYCPFVGDITNGSSVITNVAPIFSSGYVQTTIPIGARYDHPAFPFGTYVKDIDLSNAVITMSSAATRTATKQNFANGNPQVTVKSYYPPNNSNVYTYNNAFLGGTIWNEVINSVNGTSPSQPTKWRFLKGGYLNATASGHSASMQADFSIEPIYRINSGSGNLEYYNAYNDSWQSSTGSVSFYHLAGASSSALSYTSGSGAGTSPTAFSVSGSDLAGRIALTTGTGCISGSVIATVTFKNSFATPPYISLTSANYSSSLVEVWVSSSLTTFTINSSIPGLSDSSPYAWNFQTIQ